MNKVVLTSFRESPRWEGEKFSIARWKPKGYDYPDFPVPLSPIYRGCPIRHLPPDKYRVEYEKVLDDVSPILRRLLTDWLIYTNSNGAQIVLCCWCYPSRQPEYDKLFCHRILVGYWIEKHFNSSDISVVYSDGADNPIWTR